MATLHFHQTTTSTPEQFLAALVDFGPGRSKIFGNSADEYLKRLRFHGVREAMNPSTRSPQVIGPGISGIVR